MWNINTCTVAQSYNVYTAESCVFITCKLKKNKITFNYYMMSSSSSAILDHVPRESRVDHLYLPRRCLTWHDCRSVRNVAWPQWRHGVYHWQGFDLSDVMAWAIDAMLTTMPPWRTSLLASCSYIVCIPYSHNSIPWHTHLRAKLPIRSIEHLTWEDVTYCTMGKIHFCNKIDIWKLTELNCVHKIQLCAGIFTWQK